jgi:phage terminase large subunit
VIPYAPRGAFAPFHSRKQRFAALVCHRRAGKTVATINDKIRRACTAHKPNWRAAYVAPFYAQAKDVAWDYVQRFSAPVPGVQFNQAELRVDFPNGARLRLYGADNYDRLRGIYLDDVTLDEYGDMDPRAWSEVIRPALADRQGSATFIGTPKGANHFRKIWQEDSVEEGWFRLMLKASETNLIRPEELEAAKRQMTEDQYEQEFECSFEAAVVGAYYGADIKRMKAEGRITKVGYEPALPVYTAWDLGMDDCTAIWLCQLAGREVRIIDYIEGSGAGLAHYAGELRSRGYVYAEHFLPHDVEVKELGTGVSRLEVLRSLGLANVRVIPAQRVEDGINAVRMLLPRVWIDEAKAQRGVQALADYRKEFDEKTKTFRERPLHDWTSHAADAMRYLALGLSRVTQQQAPERLAPRFGTMA